MPNTQGPTPEEGCGDSTLLSRRDAHTGTDTEELSTKVETGTLILQVFFAILYAIFMLVGFVWTGLIR